MKQTRGATGGTAVPADVLSLGVLEKHFTPEGAHRTKLSSVGYDVERETLRLIVAPVIRGGHRFL